MLTSLVCIPPSRASVLFAPQQDTMLCWAACIEMVLRNYSIHVPQQIIVQTLYKQFVNVPATAQGVARILNKRVNPKEEGWAIAHSGSPTIDFVHKEISNGRPLILCLSGNPVGHAVVLTGVEVLHMKSGKKRPVSVQLLDPALGYGTTIPVSYLGNVYEHISFSIIETGSGTAFLKFLSGAR